jgi:hypothetical protein
MEDEQPGVRSHPRNREEELHRPTALPARWSVVVIGRRDLRVDRIASALLLREAVEELAERLFARKCGRKLRLETAAVESHSKRS